MRFVHDFLGIALGARPLGKRLANLWLGRLGVTRRLSAAASTDHVLRFAIGERYHAHSGTCGGCVRPGSDSWNCAELGRGRGAFVSDFRRSGSRGPESPGVYSILAVLAPARGRTTDFRAQL